ncbi:serine protease [uncultured Sulfitobacter sp.]|uniref:serine protease n=1 Tax=uncultured Sulfitobacter sp. TaxID=191468 RepID=UPI00262A3C59|nr:serine protease [uncultured Sulfitobacter sp.]
MLRLILASLFCAAVLFGTPRSASAQAVDADEVVWIQIEAQQSLARATDRARAYATLLQDVNGFAVGGGWYAIVVGPYRREDAELVLRQYRREGLVPGDSFVQLSQRLGRQFWPVGANILDNGAIDAPQSALQEDPAPQVSDATPAPQQPEPEPEPADETPGEAQRSERLLTSDERKQLQVMLKWAGFYDAAIDGAFGRGTRNAMAQWQVSNGFQQTGILTTMQRAQIARQYNAVLEGLGLRLVRDTKAGIAVRIPMNIVDFDRYEPPFAQYNATGDLGARVLLISQPGDQNTLFGLYEILQTLEIVPLNGPRERNNSSFTLVGENARTVSYTEASLRDGQIKGFTLIWPANDEERRRRVLTEMRDSFTALPGVLSASAGASPEQAIDLVAGLQVRTPKLTRSGFFVTGNGDVVTTSEVVQGCGRITLDGDTDARIVADDRARGVALLQPDVALAPLAVASFAAQPPRLQSEVALAGYSFGGALSAPSMTFGTIEDVKGLEGEEMLERLALRSRAEDAGGPVLAEDGTVIGMLAPQPQGVPQLPQDVSFALDAQTVRDVTTAAGVRLPAGSAPSDALTPFQISQRATGMTVLVSCWE